MNRSNPEKFCVSCRNDENAVPDRALTLFKFPSSPTKKLKWINILNLETVKITSRARVCENHFNKDQFVRTRLKPNAIPKSKFSILKVPTPEPVLLKPSNIRIQPKVEVQDKHIAHPLYGSSLQARMTSGPPPPAYPEPGIKVSGQLAPIVTKTTAKATKLDNCLRRLRRAKTTVRDLRAKLKNCDNLKEIFAKNPTFQRILESQIQRYVKRKSAYDEFEKTLALSIYYSCGKAGYRTLQGIGFQLPSISSMRKWMQAYQFLPGANEDVLSIVQRLTSNFEDIDRDCILTWDEMSIKEFIEYNKNLDIFEGIVDTGHFGRDLSSATEVLVFMIQGINSRWSFPVSYYLSNHATNSTVLAELVEFTILKLQQIGLNVRMGICDMSFTNQGLYRQWGITDQQPFRYFNDSKIYFIHDTPHLLKLIRNNLLKHDFLIEKKNIHGMSQRVKIKWLHIVNFF